MAPIAELLPKPIKDQFLQSYPMERMFIYDIPKEFKPYEVSNGVTALVDSRKVNQINRQDYWTPDSLRTKFMKYVYAIEFPESSIEITHESDGTLIKSQPITTFLIQCFHLAHMNLPIRFSLEPHTPSAYIAVDNYRLQKPFIDVKEPIFFRAG